MNKLIDNLATDFIRDTRYHEQQERTTNMKTFRIEGPDGQWWETTARTIEKARANFAYRMMRRGAFICDAYAWAMGAEEVKQ